MVGPSKVGGILVEQGGQRTIVVGVGLNVTNRPWVADPSLCGVAGRLADSFGAQALPERDEWVSRLLRAVWLAHREFGRIRLAGFAPVLERCWGEARDVKLEPARGVTLTATCGRFLGIDRRGAVRLRTAPGVEARVPAHHINRLREVG
jgi:biotin-(acetyl-CoA carboxylase) ligase